MLSIFIFRLMKKQKLQRIRHILNCIRGSRLYINPNKSITTHKTLLIYNFIYMYNYFIPIYIVLQLRPLHPHTDKFNHVHTMLNTPNTKIRLNHNRLIKICRILRDKLVRSDNIHYMQHKLQLIQPWYTPKLILQRSTHSFKLPILYLNNKSVNIRIALLQQQEQLPEMFLLMLWFYLYFKRPNYITAYFARVLTNAPSNRQRSTFLMLCDLIDSYLNLPHVNRIVYGSHLMLKGKINRIGSVRKQKIKWNAKAIYRPNKKISIYARYTQISTSAGSLGLTQYVSYKDE